IFDSVFDQFRGVIVYVRIVRGVIRAGDSIRFHSTGKTHEVLEVGVLRLGLEPREELWAGDVGYVIANVKVVADAKVGDTITNASDPRAEALPGYRPVKPMVFSGLYPIDAESYESRKESLAKLQRNDASLTFEPETSLALDFDDRLKTIRRGYASLDYEFSGMQPADLVGMDLLLNGEPVDALSVIVHREKAYEWGRDVSAKLKELIPRQMFPIAVQAAIGNHVIARETIPAMRKNVLAKCYGGDITRKRKLLHKQLH